MKVARGIEELRAARRKLRRRDPRPRLSLVPTMGALHAGHRSLMELARAHSEALVVSIFVNPLQFGPGEDYARYPRALEGDLAICEAAGVDVVFTPKVAEIYPPGRQVTLSAGGLGAVLEGASRPGHFDGVLTVVIKLLNIVGPDVAIFGQKDAQQLVCIRRMVADLNVGVEIVGAPTVREADGLALSSRNRYLTAADRPVALALSRALRAASAETVPSAAVAAGRAVLDAEPGVALDYFALVDPRSLAAVDDGHAGAALLVVAGSVGTTRLIDNTVLVFGG